MDRDLRAVEEAMRSGFIARGERVIELEGRVTEFCGAAGAVATGSGTAALILALRGLDIGPGDEVVIPTYVCRSVEDSVRTVGASPVLCDVGSHWWMTPETVAAVMTERTRAIVVVHIFGITAPTREMASFGVPIVEDCCQSFGGCHDDGAPVGTVGEFGVFSFHATKCLTTGEGGMLVSNDPELIGKARDMRSSNTVASPLSDLQAALGLSQLSRYRDFLARRKELADYYLEHLPAPWTERLRSVEGKTMFFRFPIVPGGGSFQEWQQRFESRGIAVRRGVDTLLHSGGDDSRAFPGAECRFAETVSLPLYPAMSSDEARHVVETARDLM